MISIALYAPSSPQRLVDCARVVFHSDIVDLLVIIKPVGMAAQVGLAEVSKLAYRLNKNLVILSQLDELKEVVDVDVVLYLVHDENAKELRNVLREIGLDKRICIVIPAGDISIPKSEMIGGEIVKHSLPRIGGVPAADVALTIYEIAKLVNRNV